MPPPAKEGKRSPDGTADSISGWRDILCKQGALASGFRRQVETPSHVMFVVG